MSEIQVQLALSMVSGLCPQVLLKDEHEAPARGRETVHILVHPAFVLT